MAKFDRSGLEAIFGKGLKEAMQDIENYQKKPGTKKPTLIPVKEIRTNPFQPRKFFDQEKIVKLAQSIKANGLIQPIVVIKDVKGYVLVVGERRLRAHKLNKAQNIAAIVVKVSQQQLQNLALIENIQREDLNPIEEAKALKEILNTQKITQEKLGAEIGKSRSYITNSLRLLTLPKEVQKLVISNDLSVGHVKVLLGLSDPIQIMELAKKIIYNELTVRDLEKLIHSITKKSLPRQTYHNPQLGYVEDLLRDKLDTKITVTKNNINIKFSSHNDLNRILKLLNLIK